MDTKLKSLIPLNAPVRILKGIGGPDAVVDSKHDKNHVFFTMGGKKLLSRILEPGALT